MYTSAAARRARCEVKGLCNRCLRPHRLARKRCMNVCLESGGPHRIASCDGGSQRRSVPPRDGSPQRQRQVKVVELRRQLAQMNAQRDTLRMLYESERKDNDDMRDLLCALEQSRCQRCNVYQKMLAGLLENDEKANADLEETAAKAINFFKSSAELIQRCNGFLLSVNTMEANMSGKAIGGEPSDSTDSGDDSNIDNVSGM